MFLTPLQGGTGARAPFMKPYTQMGTVTKAHSTHKILGVLTLPVLSMKKASSGYEVIKCYHLHFTQERTVPQKGHG